MSSFDRVLTTWSPSALCWVGILNPRFADYVSLREESLISAGFSPVVHPKEVCFS